MKEIDSVDALVREKLAGIKQNTIITYHPAWTYFTDSYGLKQISIEDHGRQPNANDLALLVKKAKKLGIKAVFIQPQFDNNTAKIIANEIGAELVEIDPLPEDFLANIVDITNKIVKYNE
jgi:zinc transport system substrate-binding protein